MDLEEKLYREKIELASLLARFFAFWIDSLILAFVFSLIHWDELPRHLNSLDGYYGYVMAMNNFFWQIILLDLVYEVTFLALYGATFGKMIFKIRVISISLLDKPNLFYALVRSLIKSLEKRLLFIPILFVFFSPYKQSLHDLLAKTIVVKNV